MSTKILTLLGRKDEAHNEIKVHAAGSAHGTRHTCIPFVLTWTELDRSSVAWVVELIIKKDNISV